MGIDISLYVEGTVTAEEFERGREEFAFRIDDTHIVRSESGWNRGQVELEQDATYTRYWGPGYERGPWPQIASWIEALRAAFPNHVIRYGGDSSEGAGPVVTDELMAEYWAHWRSPHAHDYRQAFA